LHGLADGANATLRVSNMSDKHLAELQFKSSKKAHRTTLHILVDHVLNTECLDITRHYFTALFVVIPV